jgi:uncharacterized protein (TIGR00369 family)
VAAFESRDPHFAARVRSSFERQGIMEHLGAQLREVAPGYCEIRLGYSPALSQQHGYFHGGVIGTIADSAAGYAGYSLMAEGSSVLTVEYKLNLMSPADGDALIARGHVIKTGRTLVITRADVFNLKDGREKMCATLLQTLMCMKDLPDKRGVY